MIKEDKIKSLDIVQILYQNQEINTEQKNEIIKFMQGNNNKTRVETILKNQLYVSQFKEQIRELIRLIKKEENNVN